MTVLRARVKSPQGKITDEVVELWRNRSLSKKFQTRRSDAFPRVRPTISLVIRVRL